MMYKYTLTIGLNDKDAECQLINTDDAKNTIADSLLNKYDIFAFTMWDCVGCYKMGSTGNIVRETSIRLEIASDDDITSTIYVAIDYLKIALNQECIMVEKNVSNIRFK